MGLDVGVSVDTTPEEQDPVVTGSLQTGPQSQRVLQR